MTIVDKQKSLFKINGLGSQRMVDITSKNILSGFAYYLSEAKFMDSQTALNALQEATANKASYIDYLVKQKLLDESRVAQAAADYFGLPLFDITAFDTTLIPTEYINIHFVQKRKALPLFKKKGMLYIATIDPTLENLDEMRFLTGLDIRILVVETSKMEKIIDNLFNAKLLIEMSNIDTNQFDVTVDAYKDENLDFSAYDIESAPVVNYVNKILIDAIERGASDIHFERYEDSYRIRYRQDGILYVVAAPPVKMANYLIARIKVMAHIDITEHRIPQDGRFKLTLSRKRSVDFRVSVCPVLFGEKVVLRILNPAQLQTSLNQLGMDSIQQEHTLDALKHSQGMILVTGPTGSGKTVTLYSALNFLNSTERNVSTAEDPVEIPMQGVNQVHVNPKVGLTFSTALRAFLRQDPDVIMVGEIRDLETAEIAVKASQTGHLVLSTLHTNSAPETIVRLMNMGVEPFNLASSLILIIAQRLVRLLCNTCKQKVIIPPDVLIAEGFKEEEMSTLELYRPDSCNHCTNGFKGRAGIFEVMPISEEMKHLIMQGGDSLAITALAKKEGIADLRESGLKKVKVGLTSLEELNRVFK